jgi:hypothetical protein
MVSKLVCVAFFSLIIFSGCSIKDTVKKGSDEKVLRDRIMAFWNHKINKEFDKSYEYEDPLFRKKISMMNYISSFHAESAKAKWLEASIESIKLEDDIAKVDMKLKLRLFATASQAKAVEHEVPIREKWVRVDGNWFHVVKQAGISTN